MSLGLTIGNESHGSVMCAARYVACHYHSWAQLYRQEHHHSIASKLGILSVPSKNESYTWSTLFKVLDKYSSPGRSVLLWAFLSCCTFAW